VAEQKQEIAAGMVDEMVPGTLYLLGPGTTVRAVADALGVEKTLLGVDAVVDGERVGVDLNERALLALLDDYPERRIIVTPIGGNGFVFGRGNKQLTPAVLRRVGSEHVIIVATPEKLADVDVLRVDTGDAELDALLSGYREVVVGYRRARMIKVVT
jgi:predicted polyphosphate/ATP-dependent NAD kinase